MTLTLEEAQKLTDRLHGKVTTRRKDLTTYDDFYRGKQPLAFASEHWRDFHGNRYAGFSDNWCGPVANAPSERLRLDGIRLPGDRPGDMVQTEAERELWDIWLYQELDVQSSQGFLDSMVGARSYVLVWGDEDDEPEVTWEDASQVIVAYDPEHPRRRKAALKTWRDDTKEFATLYTPDEVWKFQRDTSHVVVEGGRTQAGLIIDIPALAGYGGGWKPRQPSSDDTWPLSNPLGVVPVVEYRNRPMLRGEPISEIDGVMAMQNAINLLWAYLFGAADYASMPSRVILGQDMPTIPVLDDEGKIVGHRPMDLEALQRDRFLLLPNKDAKLGEFTASNLDVFTSVIEVAVGHVAAQTRTPPHYLATNKGLANLNGDALKAAETGLTKKVEEQQLFYTPDVRETFRLIALVKNDAALAQQAARATMLWKNAEIRSDSQLVDQLLKFKTMTFPVRWIAERYGLTPSEVDRLMQMREEEAASDPFAAAAGLLPPPPTPEQLPPAPEQ